MEAQSFEYSDITNKWWLFLFVLLELGTIVISFLFNYKIGIFLPLVFVFILMIFGDVKVNLMILIALSAMVNYKNTTTLAFGISMLAFVLAALFLNIYIKSCLDGLTKMKGKIVLPLSAFILLVVFNAFRGLLSSYKITYWGLETFVYLSFGLVFLIMIFFESYRDVVRFFNILILLANGLSIYGIVTYLSVGHRIGGTIFGIIPGMVAMVLLNLFFYSKNKLKRLRYLLLSFLPILHLIFSFTRGYWLGFMVALTFSYAFYVSQLKHTIFKRSLIFIRGFVVASIAFFLGVVLLQRALPGDGFIGAVLNRFRSGFSVSYSRDTISNYQRILEYRGAIEKIKEKPVWGFGIGYGFDFRDWLAQKTYVVRAVHHDYLAIVLKMGLIGLLVFLWLLYVFFSNGTKIWRRAGDEYLKGLTAGLLANVLQLLVIGFTNHVFIEVMNTFYLAFAIGAVEKIGGTEE